MIKKIGLIVTSCLVSIIIIELILQVNNVKFTLKHEWSLADPVRIRNDNVCIIAPNLLAKSKYIKENDEKIIVSIGDSFTEGYPQNGHGYPEQLQDRLKLLTSKKFTVLNFGLGDSGPDQHLRIFKELILPSIKPDIVLWSIYANDIRDNVTFAMYSTQNENKLKKLDCSLNFWYTRNIFYNLPIPSIVKKRSILFRLLLKSTEGLINIPIPNNYKNRTEMWGNLKFKLEIEEMEELSKRYNFEIYYILITPQGMYALNNIDKSMRNWEETGYSLLKKTLYSEVNNNSIVDLNFNQINNNSQVNVLGTATDYGTKFFSDENKDMQPFGDRHFNESGYQIFTDMVYEKILHENIYLKNINNSKSINN